MQSYNASAPLPQLLASERLSLFASRNVIGHLQTTPGEEPLWKHELFIFGPKFLAKTPKKRQILKTKVQPNQELTRSNASKKQTDAFVGPQHRVSNAVLEKRRQNTTRTLHGATAQSLKCAAREKTQKRRPNPSWGHSPESQMRC